MKRFLCLMIAAGIAGFFPSVLRAADLDWPRQIDSRDATIIVYQPQLEQFDNDILTARAAVSVQKATDTAPVFGAVWFEAQVETDREQRNVRMRNVRVLQSRFPEATDKQAKQYEQLFARQASGWDLDMSLDQMLAMLDEQKRAGIEVRDLKNDPPKVYYRTHPALLVLVDGEPKLQPVDGSKVMRVINSPMYVVFEPTLKTFYLKIGDEWFASARMQGNWRGISQPPTTVLDAAARVDFPPVPPEIQSSLDSKPEIVVSYEPAELIVSDGEPEYALVEGTGLLYMSNSDSDVFMEIDSQRYYVVLSGRWYRSQDLGGPWEYVPAGKLPADFGRIPENSPKQHVLAHIPGTTEANEAILDATIPQTERIERDRSLDVEYDGTPEFAPVSGVDVAYAVNSPVAVLRVDGRYYACNDAVWFVAGSPYGPWRVAISVPSVIYSLPPSCPVYYVRYVYVYGYTPDIVYVGYTPGYVGTYVYRGTIVYGTGYHYRPWYRTRYYPRPLTWGFHVNYDTFYGWSFGVGVFGHYGNLWYSIGSGWWGPVHHRHHYYNDVSYNINRNINRSVIIKRPGNIYRPVSKETWQKRWTERDRDRRDYRERYSRGNARSGSVGRDRSPDRTVTRDRDRSRVETDDRNRGRTQQQPTVRRGDRDDVRSDRDRRRSNDIYTDRQGNIYRRTDKGWEKRDRGDWKPDTKVERRDNGKSVGKVLDREYRARERGEERTREQRRPDADWSSRGNDDRGRSDRGWDDRGRSDRGWDDRGRSDRGADLTFPDKRGRSR